MKEVKVMPKFKCDFCKKRAVKSAMEKHEVICWYNPNRKCRTCDGEGLVVTPRANIDGVIIGEETDECLDCNRAEEIKRSKAASA